MQPDDAIDLKRLYLIVRRQLLLIIVLTFCFVGSAVGYLKYTTPLYTSQTRLLLDKTFTGAISENSSKKMAFDNAAIESEVEVIRSRGVTEAVIKKLLDKDYFPDLKNDPTKLDQVVQQMLSNLQVKRVGETYVLSIQFTSAFPEIAALVSNSFAEAYISDQLNSMSLTSNRTLGWLEEKTEEIKEELILAQKKVANYRLNYNNSKLKERKNIKSSPQEDRAFDLNELTSLEKDVASLEELYDSYLEKLDSLNLQQSYPVTETRVITYASTPSNPSHPKNTLILGASLILGLGLSLLIALIRDNFDKTLRRAGQVTREIGVSFLGFFPKSRKKARQVINFTSPQGEECLITMYAQSIENEFSLCAETIRSVKNAIENQGDNLRGKVIGVVSALPKENSSVIANNLALYTAHGDHKTLYIDANLRNPIAIKSKSKNLHGLGSVLFFDKKLDDVALKCKDLKLSFLPSFLHEAGRILPSADQNLIGSLFDKYKDDFAYTIIDLPPLIGGSDAYSFAKSIDYYVIVSEWGKTLPNSLNFYIQQNNIDKEKIIGLVLNKANMTTMKKFYGHKTYSR